MLEKPAIFQEENSLLTIYFDWNDTQYSDFMTRILRALEPRIYISQEYILEEGEEVEEQIYVINRDPLKPIIQTGFYCIGFSVKKSRKYYMLNWVPSRSFAVTRTSTIRTLSSAIEP